MSGIDVVRQAGARLHAAVTSRAGVATEVAGGAMAGGHAAVAADGLVPQAIAYAGPAGMAVSAGLMGAGLLTGAWHSRQTSKQLLANQISQPEKAAADLAVRRAALAPAKVVGLAAVPISVGVYIANYAVEKAGAGSSTADAEIGQRPARKPSPAPVAEPVG